jgi:alanine-glyoxylate transaminase/serine-glyoxylate transaminase/serine-pyruvate transaminase
MSAPVLGIRDPYFLQVIQEVRQGLCRVFGTANAKTFPVPAGGSGAMEAAVVNFLRPGEKLAVFASGHFSDRISIMGQRHGAQVARLERPWGHVFSADEADEFLDREKPDAIAFVQAETSTGAYQSGRNIVPAARRHGALVIADTVTSLGAMPVELDDVGVDVAFSCSQKGLSCPAGLSPMSVSPSAWARLEARTEASHAWYLDLKLMAQYYDPPHVYHHTPAPPLWYALHQGLAVVEEEGLENRWKRHRQTSEQLARGLTELGFEYLVPLPDNRIWHLAAVLPPRGVAEADLRQRLVDRYGIEIASGLGQLSGKILRIGTMGPLATPDRVSELLAAIQRCL